MKLAFAFIKWILANMFSRIRETDTEFRYTLQHRPWEAVFFWFIISLLTSVVTLILLAGLQYVTGFDIPVQIWFGYMISCVIYLLYTGFSVMYNAFKAERAELFETIKNGR